MQNTHPDVVYITQEKATSAIKIDQIRSLQDYIYQTPLCSTHRMIIIYPAHELNRAAANALLKILEEPPKHAIFVLLAEHLNTLPATIMSRCQRYDVPDNIPESHTGSGYLSSARYDLDDCPRGTLLQQQQDIINKLCDLSEGKISVCQLASTLGKHELQDWLWFFQLFTASLIKYKLLPEASVVDDGCLQSLIEAYSPVHFFKQLDIIQELKKKINQDIPLNPTLALETLLMGYVR
jgi:DNA polymerase-3 subunit delta'